MCKTEYTGGIAKGSALDDGGLPLRDTIVKAMGLGDATNDPNDSAFALGCHVRSLASSPSLWYNTLW
jgi:hypothetical protein